MVPDVGVSRPAIVRRSVVLPAPVGPSTTRSSSLATVRSIPESASVAPKRLVIPESARNESGMVVPPVFPGCAVEDVNGRGVERQRDRGTDRMAGLRADDDPSRRRADVHVAVRAKVLVEHDLPRDDTAVPGPHVLGSDT